MQWMVTVTVRLYLRTAWGHLY